MTWGEGGTSQCCDVFVCGFWGGQWGAHGYAGCANTHLYPSTWEAESHRSLNLRTAWSTQRAPRQIGLHGETLSQSAKDKTKQNKTK